MHDLCGLLTVNIVSCGCKEVTERSNKESTDFLFNTQYGNKEPPTFIYQTPCIYL